LLSITVIVKLAIIPSGKGPQNETSLSSQTKKIRSPFQCFTVNVEEY
jgi:hypothetical protein